MIRTLAAACLMSLAAGAIATSADAKTIFETATFTGVDTGEYIVSDTRYFGVAFTLDKTTEITGIGGQFGGFPSRTIFGAIVSCPPRPRFRISRQARSRQTALLTSSSPLRPTRPISPRRSTFLWAREHMASSSARAPSGRTAMVGSAVITIPSARQTSSPIFSSTAIPGKPLRWTAPGSRSQACLRLRPGR